MRRFTTKKSFNAYIAAGKAMRRPVLVPSNVVLPCPQCNRQPYIAATINGNDGRAVVTYRCDCGYQWEKVGM